MHQYHVIPPDGNGAVLSLIVGCISVQLSIHWPEEGAIKDGWKHGIQESSIYGDKNHKSLKTIFPAQTWAIPTYKPQDTSRRTRPMPTSPRIFISYSRKDGCKLALRLKADLEAHRQTVWLDTSEIDGGASWSRDIEIAIDSCETVLALLSRDSYKSEICRSEQLRALRKQKRLIPILVQSDAERPIYIESANYRDFSAPARYDERFAQLLADLHKPYTAPELRRVPNTTPVLPNHFVNRPTKLEQQRGLMVRYQVVPSNGYWSVLLARTGYETVEVSRHPLKEAAINDGRNRAKRDRCELTIHGLDGTIQESWSYGNDPYPPKG
jgi:hypothetical protein